MSTHERIRCYLPDIENTAGPWLKGWQATLLLVQEKLNVLNIQPAHFTEDLSRLLLVSDYAVQRFLNLAFTESELQSWYENKPVDFISDIKESIEKIDDIEAIRDALCILRHRVFLRILFRDLNGFATLTQTISELSNFADAIIHTALIHVARSLQSKFSQLNIEECLKNFVIFGLGKLGAHELNLSSDVDVVYVYAAPEDNDDSTELIEFYTALAQQLGRFLSEQRGPGFLYRVDTRLRPFGLSGPLVWSISGMLSYYEEHGREWERYAWVKGRPIAGNLELGKDFLQKLRPFVYRRYLDFGVIDALRDLKLMIQKEILSKQLEHHIKLGSGGIREVEFIVQVLQLIHGGRKSDLREPTLQTVLPRCVEYKLLQPEDAELLLKAYRFFRHTEHRLQAVSDTQTHLLPTAGFSQARLAWSMGFKNWNEYNQELKTLRTLVHELFVELVERKSVPEDDKTDPVYDLIWVANESPHTIPNLNTEDTQKIIQIITEFKKLPEVTRAQAVARQRLDHLMPILLRLLIVNHVNYLQGNIKTNVSPEMSVVLNEFALEWAGPVIALERVLSILQTVMRRSAYITLLNENIGALRDLIRLCGASSWITQQLATTPSLLDEFVDAAKLYAPPDEALLEEELRQQLLRIPEDNLDWLLDRLRQFKQGHVLRVAACDIAGRLPLTRVSDYLTFIAEAVLGETLRIAWNELVSRYGYPRDAQNKADDKGLVVIGYGKLGGIELNYGSDLDLVFLYDVPPQAMTDGEHSIENDVFFIKLAKKIIHLISIQTAQGLMYDIDLRLRPSGSSGLLVSSFQSFEKYQLKEAWTWEHQALVRARPVAGHLTLKSKFETVRHTVLCQPRDTEKLKYDIVAMRDKMRRHLSSSQANGIFDVKQDLGGIVDVEFIVQYAVLCWAHHFPSLVRFTDNTRILDVLTAENLIPAADAQSLREAYFILRAVTHRIALQNQKSGLAATSLKPYREAVQKIWLDWFGEIENTLE